MKIAALSKNEQISYLRNLNTLYQIMIDYYNQITGENLQILQFIDKNNDIDSMKFDEYLEELFKFQSSAIDNLKKKHELLSEKIEIVDQTPLKNLLKMAAIFLFGSAFGMVLLIYFWKFIMDIKNNPGVIKEKWFPKS